MSVTGSNFPPTAREQGFTLVELMVVLVILGLTSAAVLFALPDPRGSVRDAGERFAARARAAQDGAIVSGRPLALNVDARGYRFERRQAGRWAAAGEPALAPQHWGGGIVAVIVGDGRVLFDPTGGVDPLAVRLERDGLRTEVRIAADGSVHVE